MEAKPQYWRKWAISRDPADINNPANAPYLYEGPNGEKFIDWYNPGHKLENWAKRLSILATGAPEEIDEHYTTLYYSRLVRKLGIGPDAPDNAQREMNAPNVIPLPERKPSPFETDEILIALRKMKREIAKLNREKYLLAMRAAQSGCPEDADPHCAMTAFPPRGRESVTCAACWLKHAERTIVKPATQTPASVCQQENIAGMETA